MPARLDIAYIELRNFLSYGDYPTRLSVRDEGGSSLGPVLVLGEFEANDSDDSTQSNGAGKSTLLTAFIWCLFGRTVNNPNPGDKVVNWYSERNCYVKIVTTDGWEITRTRQMDGHSELLVSKDGDQSLSTTRNTQEFIEQQFGLDFEIFIASVFCGQLGKSFLETPPVKRKEALERLLGLDKLNGYAEKAKEKCTQVESKQTSLRAKVQSLQSDLQRWNEQLDSTNSSVATYETDRATKIASLRERQALIREQISCFVLPDIDNLTQSWATYEGLQRKAIEYRTQVANGTRQIQDLTNNLRNAEEVIKQATSMMAEPDIEALRAGHERADIAERKRSDLTTQMREVQNKASRSQAEIARLEKVMSGWRARTGTVCQSCGQDVGEGHVDRHLGPLQENIDRERVLYQSFDEQITKYRTLLQKLAQIQRPDVSLREAESIIQHNKRALAKAAEAQSGLDRIRADLEDLKIKVDQYKSTTVLIESKIEVTRPEMSLGEANKLIVQFSQLKNQIDVIESRIGEVTSETNPYISVCQEIEIRISGLQHEMEILEAEVKQLDVVYAHLNYVYKSYSDRRKIKSWLLAELIPFFNDRIHYYLDAFGVEMGITFTATLSDQTDKWDYEFCSGGERKKIDLSIMFALHDLYLSIYGPQCNFMVLDEVDSRLDRHGIEVFGEVVNAIANPPDGRYAPDAIFVVSHKSELKDLFPTQIVIRKVNGQSTLST